MSDVIDDLEAAYKAELPPTIIPGRSGVREAVRRTLGGASREGVLNLAGAALSAVCVSLLLFGRLASLSGPLGFVVVTYVVFLVIYGFVTAVTESRPVVVDKIMTVVFATAAAIAFLALASVIIFVIWRGWSAIAHLNLYTHDMSRAGPTSPLSKGGISHAVVGTLIIIAIAILVTVPLGITCAVYLNESRGRGVRVVRTLVDAMMALPSILAGLFVFATLILTFGFQRSGLAAGLATSIVMLPIIIRSADVVLRLVPGSLREASAATGAPQWRTVWHVVLPTARSGLATAVILGIARGIGETAPVLLTAGFTASMNTDPLKSPMVTLPLAAFEFVRSPQGALIARGFATAFVLMILVVVLFAVARFLGGRPAGHLSKRQAQRAARQSRRDLERFNARLGEIG